MNRDCQYYSIDKQCYPAYLRFSASASVTTWPMTAMPCVGTIAGSSMADSSSQISGVVGTDGDGEYGVENVGVIVPVVGVGNVSEYGVDETVPVDGGVVN